MATYVSKLWVDRQSTNPNRRTLSWIDPDTQQEKTLTVTVTREEGTVTVEGDPFAALVMNGLEERISNAFATCDNILVSTNSPTAADGKNNDMFVKYSTSGGSTTITNLYIKISDAWVEVATGGGGGSSTLAGLSDVDLTSPTDGQALVYDSASSKWVNGAGGGSSASGVYIGTCDTAGNQSAKQVTVSADQGFVLEKGTTIAVFFSNNNSASNVTLSVNNGTAYPIYYSAGVYSGNVSNVCGLKDSYIFYTWDGTNWVWLNMDKYMTYNNMTQAEAEAGTSTNGRLLQPTILKHAIDYHAPSAVRVDLTQAEYDQLSDAEKNNGMLYFITDADSVYAPVELTQAQYDQLTSDEKHNGTIYFITDAPSNPVDYSTDEKVIGHWVDGKTLYERTFDYNLSDMSGGTQSETAIVGRFDLPPAHYDTLWIEQAFILNDSPDSSFTLKSFPLPTIQNNGAYIRTQIQKTDANDGYPFIYIDVQWSISQLYSKRTSIHYVYVLRYTK